MTGVKGLFLLATTSGATSLVVPDSWAWVGDVSKLSLTAIVIIATVILWKKLQEREVQIDKIYADRMEDHDRHAKDLAATAARAIEALERHGDTSKRTNELLDKVGKTLERAQDRCEQHVKFLQELANRKIHGEGV
jgi:cell division protein ZapA (FtsZ GTPase activity inhibitor)